MKKTTDDPRKERLSEWLVQIDDDLLNEAYSVDNADRLKKQTESKKICRKMCYMQNPMFRRILVAALCLFLLIGVMLAVPALFGNGDPADTSHLSDGSGDGKPPVRNELEHNTHSSEAPTHGDSLPNADSSEAGRPPLTSVPEQNTSSEAPTHSDPDRSEAGKPPMTDEPGQDTSSEAPSHGNGLPNTVIPTEQLHIDSIDMLNYYSAIRILTESSNSPFAGLAAGGRNFHGISQLSAGGSKEPNDDVSYEVSDDVSYDDPTEVPDVREEQPIDSPSEPPQIYYYELDPGQVFSFTNALFFQIELTDETGFLASKLGTGIVDVVITDGVFGDALITFKSGERYFSCLTNSGVYNGVSSPFQLQFSTHKFIDGFYVVKNFEQPNYQFIVSFNGDQIDYFECAEWDKADKPADGILPIVGETRVSNKHIEFTIAELEAYFN